MRNRRVEYTCQSLTICADEKGDYVKRNDEGTLGLVGSVTSNVMKKDHDCNENSSIR